MARTYRFIIGTAAAGLRLDHYLTRRLPASVSRAMIQRGIRAGDVTVSERPIKAHYKLRSGDRVIARFAQLSARGGDAVLRPQAIPLEVVYEDAELLVVNKPAGLVTHPAPGHWDGTLVNAVLWHLTHAQGSRFKAQGKNEHLEPSAFSLEQQLPRAGIVHRLDKDTSGLLLVAKNEEAHVALSRQLKARTIHRRYLALVEGHVPLSQGTIDVPIGRHAIHRKEMTVRHLGGRSAVTHYRVLKRWNAECGMRNAEFKPKIPHPAPRTPHPFFYTALDVTLDTGRTHQIRVHMAHIGHPVIGDTTYGDRPPSYWATLGIGRHLLHARELTFHHPVSRKTVTVSTAVPDDMARWLAEAP